MGAEKNPALGTVSPGFNEDPGTAEEIKAFLSFFAKSFYRSFGKKMKRRL